MLVSRTAWHDWFVGDGESAVYVGDTVTVLSDLATVVVDLVGDDGADLAVIADGLAETFGAPEGVDLVSATRERVDELVAAGILHVTPVPA